MKTSWNDMTRRAVLASAAAAALVSALPAMALTAGEAEALIQQATGEINAVINSGKSEGAMYRDFERIFARYADVPTIARSALGPDARRASQAQLRALTQTFQGYMARKYGRRFREFIGGRVVVQGARPVNSFFEVNAVADLRGQAPFAVTFLVSDRSGRDKFFDLLIEGISLLRTERTEMGAMLDRNGGSIDALIAQLQRAG
jgi:phospholipid transport system substrate-binding protein